MTELSDAALDHLRRMPTAAPGVGDRYELLGVLGEGGMGVVYHARDRVLDRDVALKVMRPELAPGLDTERLRREARILARLEHPGIVPVHDAGTLADGRLFYVMKLIRGERLDRHMVGRPLAELLRLYLRICEAVGFAHARGVVHRDLKPSNIMIGAYGDVVVLDWGIAAVVEQGRLSVAKAGVGDGHPRPMCQGSPTARLTRPGAVVGTPGYMAPEQERGDTANVDQRADVYALGVILRDLLGASGAAVPSPLAAIRDCATAPASGHRYPTAEQLAAEVTRYLNGERVLAYVESPLERVRRVAHRYRTPILLVLAYLAMRLAFLAVSGF